MHHSHSKCSIIQMFPVTSGKEYTILSRATASPKGPGFETRFLAS